MKGVNETGRPAIDRLLQRRGLHRQNEKAKVKVRERENDVLQATGRPGHLLDLLPVQGPHHDPLRQGDTRLAAVLHPPPAAQPGDGQGIDRAATKVNSLVIISWPAIALETNASTCMSEGVAEDAPHPEGLPHRLLSRKAVLAKERVKANQGHLPPLAYVISIAGESVRTETSANFNMLILPHQRLEEDPSQRLSLNRQPPPSESLVVMLLLAWPSTVFLKTMTTSVSKPKR